jgi:hypothetical protein
MTKFRLDDILDDLDAAAKRGVTREQPDGGERVADADHPRTIASDGGVSQVDRPSVPASREN